MNKSILVCNRSAGRGTASSIDLARDALSAHGALDEIDGPREAALAEVTGKLGSGVTRIYALGGDGTAGAVAGVLVGTDIPLGVIPLGTTNVLARECRIPLDPVSAAHALARSTRTRAFQTWSTGFGTLLLGLGLGFDARLMANTPAEAKRRWGLLAVGATAMRELTRYDFPDIEITGEDDTGREFKACGTSVLVGNIERYAGDALMMPGADPADEVLDLIVLSSRRRRDLAMFWLRSALPGASHLRVRGVSTLRARSVRFDGPRPVEAHLNGDAHGCTPVQLQPSGPVQLVVPE